MKIYWILEHGDEIKAGDEIWDYITMNWEPFREGDGWIGERCDAATAKCNQPIRRALSK